MLKEKFAESNAPEYSHELANAFSNVKEVPNIEQWSTDLKDMMRIHNGSNYTGK